MKKDGDRVSCVDGNPFGLNVYVFVKINENNDYQICVLIKNGKII